MQSFPGDLLHHDGYLQKKDMAFDFKKEYKEFYLPKGTPSIVTVPAMNFIAVRGKGDPNDEDGEYMSKMGDHRIE